MKRMLIDIRSEKYERQLIKDKKAKNKNRISENSWLEVIWKEKEKKRWKKS